MQLSMRSNVFLLFVAILVLVDVPKAASRHEYNFSACGGAQLCLGASKLERLRRRSGLVTKTIQQLAKELDDDEDMVGRMICGLTERPYAAVVNRLLNSLLLLPSTPCCSWCCVQLTQGVDTTNDLLVVSCAGLIAPPPPPNTKTGSSSSSSKVSELRRQQHHHHRSLKGGFIPTPADAEIVSGWLVRKTDAVFGRAAFAQEGPSAVAFLLAGSSSPSDACSARIKSMPTLSVCHRQLPLCSPNWQFIAPACP